MEPGLRVVTMAIVVCFMKTSYASKVTVYDFANSSMHQHVEAGSRVDFICKGNASDTAILEIANETIVQAKGIVWKHVLLERKQNKKTVTCRVKDASGKTIREKSDNLDIWFPPVPANKHIRHHYKLMVGHINHISIHFQANPVVNSKSGHVRVIGPKGKNIHNFNVAYVPHPHRTTDHFVLLTFHETKHTDFGNYSLIVTSNHFPHQPMIQNFTIADFEAQAGSSNGGVVAAIVIGCLLTIGLVALMVFLVMRSKRRQPLPEARRPIVTEEGMEDDVFAENRPGSSRIDSVEHSVM